MTRSAAGVTALLCALLGAPLSHGPAQAATLNWPVPGELALPAFDTSFFLLVAPYVTPRPTSPRPRTVRQAGFQGSQPLRGVGLFSLPSQDHRDSLLVHPWFLQIATGTAQGPGAPARGAAWARLFQQQLVILIPAPAPWTWWAPQGSPGPGSLPPGNGAGPGVGPPPGLGDPPHEPIVAGQQPSPVPLPGSAVLLAAALAFGVFFGRRRA